MRAALPFLLPALLACAEDTSPVTIRPSVKPGAKITRSLDIRGKGTLTITSGEDSRDFECETCVVEERAEEVLEAKDGRATKAKRRYSEKKTTTKVPSVGKDDEKSSSLVGRLLTLERKDGRTETTCADRNVEPRELAGETFDDEWDMPLSPAGPLAVGDEWKPSPDAVKAWASSRGRKVSEAALSCKLAEVADHAGRRCARITVDFSAKATTKGGDKQPEQTIAWTLKGDVWWSLEDGRALEMKETGDLVIEWDAKAEGKAAEHWKNVSRIEVAGSSAPGKADFPTADDQKK